MFGGLRPESPKADMALVYKFENLKVFIFINTVPL